MNGKTAQGVKGRIDLTLHDLTIGRLVLAVGAYFWQFLLW